MAEPQVIFLGLCERAVYVRDGNTNLFKWNIVGLRNSVVSHIYPLPVQGIALGFAVWTTNGSTTHRLQIVDELDKELFNIEIIMEFLLGSSSLVDPLPECEGPARLHLPKGCLLAFSTIEPPGFLIEKPGTYYIRAHTERGPSVIGELRFHHVDAPPLTEDRIAAIRSDPRATKAVRVEFGCKSCPSKFRVYTAIEIDEKTAAEGWVWYQDIPDRFICSCGISNLDVSLTRRNLHALLGQRFRPEGHVRFTPLYEKSSLESIRVEFAALLRTARKEEQLQRFIHENPVILHQFPAERLFPKPPILTSYFADFGIVTPNRELILIELEKPSTRLIQKKGGVASELSHAFDQVRDWLHVADEHRMAFLDSLGINREQVGSVKAVVIAGRDRGYDAQHMRKLKGFDMGRVSFMTYDDILSSMDALIRRIEDL